MAVKKGGKDQATLRDFQATSASANAELPGLVACTGDCEYLRGRAATCFRDSWLERFPGGDIATIRGTGEGRTVGIADIIGELSGGSLFAKEKLVIVRQAERILFPQGGRAGQDEAAQTEAKPSGDREKAFIEWLEKPAKLTWLFLETASLPRNRTLGKRVAEHCHIIPCPLPTQRDIPPWLFGKAKELGKRLDDAAVDLLVRSHGADLGILESELDKLALYAGDKEAIDASMAGEFLTGTIEFDIFNFTNAVEARDAAQAVHYARRIATQGTRDQRGKREGADSSAHKVMSMLAGTVQGLLRARVARALGADAGDFASAEKLSPWRASKLLEAAGRYSLRELRLMARYAADQIRRAHDTGGDALLSLELMAVRFTGRNTI